MSESKKAITDEYIMEVCGVICRFRKRGSLLNADMRVFFMGFL